MRFFLAIAIFGFLASVVAHGSTFFGVDPQEVFPYVWILHILLFVVCVPAVVLQPRRDETKPNRTWRQQVPFAPRWMINLTGIFFAYMFVNFGLFIYRMHDGTPSKRADGTYYIHEHSRDKGTISAERYHQLRAYEVRGFSGHWMLFYLGASTVLTSEIRRRDQENLAAGAAPRIAVDGALEQRVREIAMVSSHDRPTFAVPIWAHATLTVFAFGIGWLGGPLLFGTVLSHHLPKNLPWIVGAILFFGSGIGSALLLRSLVKRLIPARCPICGGRALRISSSPQIYRCQNCLTEHRFPELS